MPIVLLPDIGIHLYHHIRQVATKLFILEHVAQLVAKERCSTNLGT